MATFTSIPQTASFSFKHFDPSSLKRTQSKSETKVPGHTLHRDRTEGATHPLELLHQCKFGSSAMQANQSRLSRVQIAKATFAPSLYRSRRRTILKMLRRWTQPCAMCLKQAMEQAYMVSRLATITTSLTISCSTKKGWTTPRASQHRIRPRTDRLMEAAEVGIRAGCSTGFANKR
jgi:hypothetical protein